MSFNAIAWAWQTPLRHPAKLVLLALANRADAKHECFPSLSTIADDLGWSKHSTKTVRRGLSELHELGYIEVFAQYLGKGQQTSNRFKINVGFIHKPLPTGGRAENPRGADSPTPSEERPVHPARAESTPRADSPGVGADNPTNQSTNHYFSRTTEEVTRTRENDDLEALEAQMVEEVMSEAGSTPARPTADDFFAILQGRAS